MAFGSVVLCADGGGGLAVHSAGPRLTWVACHGRGPSAVRGFTHCRCVFLGLQAVYPMDPQFSIDSNVWHKSCLKVRGVRVCVSLCVLGVPFCV